MHTNLDTFRGYIEGQTRLAAEQPRRELSGLQKRVGLVTARRIIPQRLAFEQATHG
ncbi:MAG: hypothetical protein QOD99_2241 [Chthoniobacter sp.]|nr:hypothetical protein [Chthoniobacter sp.]